jgi:hypothetical protein
VSTARNLTDLKLDWNVICLCLIHLLHIDGIIDKFPSFHALGVSRVEEARYIIMMAMALLPCR